MKDYKRLEQRALLRVSVFGVVTLVFVIFSFIGLSMNSQGAKDRYDTLIAVDQAGGDVETALNDLRGYIYAHMNTQIGSELGIHPPIQLRGTYERLVAAEEAAAIGPNSDLYQEAQQDCERRNPTGFSGSNRLDCIAEYIDENGTAGNAATVIEDDLYKFDFVPPRWSPDFAGFSIVFASLFGLIFVIDLFLYLRTRHMVNMGQ